MVAKGLMEDRDLQWIGSEIPLELAIYIRNPFKFFALLHEDKHANSYFLKKNSSISRGSVLNRAAFNILQWAHYGNAPLFECDDNTVVAAKNLIDDESCSIPEEGAGEDCDNVDTIVAKEEEIDENDMENSERLLDDDFKDVEKLVKNQKEIEVLRKQNSDQENHIKLLEENVNESESL